MIPLDGVIGFLHGLAALSGPTQVIALLAAAAAYAVLLIVAWRIGSRNSAELKDANADLSQQVEADDAKRRELRRQAAEIARCIESLQAQSVEQRLAHAEKERADGNEERALQRYQDILRDFGPHLARCCEALAAIGNGPEAERLRSLRELFADADAQR